MRFVQFLFFRHALVSPVHARKTLSPPMEKICFCYKKSISFSVCGKNGRAMLQ